MKPLVLDLFSGAGGAGAHRPPARRGPGSRGGGGVMRPDISPALCRICRYNYANAPTDSLCARCAGPADDALAVELAAILNPQEDT